MDNQQEEFDGSAEGPEAESLAGRTSRLQRRLSALEGRQRQPEPVSILRLLNTDELHQALALIERAGVMPDGDVRHPEAFQEASPKEREALEHWRKLCGEPLDHLELAEELLDRVGERRGWRSSQALDIALLLKRLELPNESSWFVRKTAEAVVALYAEMDEHGVGRGGASLHPHVHFPLHFMTTLLVAVFAYPLNAANGSLARSAGWCGSRSGSSTLGSGAARSGSARIYGPWRDNQ